MGTNLNVSNKQEIDWKAVLVFVSIAFSSQCGGGFASGSTPWTYFSIIQDFMVYCLK